MTTEAIRRNCSIGSYSFHISMAARKAVDDWTIRVQVYHCSGSDTVVGGANVSSSIFAMLFVGWLVGVAMGAGLALYLRGRRSHEAGNKNLSLTASPAAAVSTRPRTILSLCSFVYV